MGMKKKAFFYTAIAIALSIVIILSYNVYTDYRLKDKMESIEIRVGTMNNFIRGLESDIENAIFIVGFRSLLSLEDYMMAYDKFFNEVGIPSRDSAFNDAFLEGTIDFSGTPQKMGLMENNTFINWTEKMKVQADKIGIILDFAIDSVTISQSSPWLVDVSVNLRIDVQDKKNAASWTIDKTYTRKINITTPLAAPLSEKKFIDPLYLVNNNGLVNNTIRAVSGSSSLGTHLLNSYYIEHADAPSYLMRFENNLNPSPYGIESLVNSQKLMDAGLAAKDRSAVDYIYYGTAITTNCVVDEPEYDWFKLDYAPTNHLGFYNAQCDDD